MLITQKPKENNASPHSKTIAVDLEWFEVNKRIQHKSARDGKTFRLKFLKENPNFQQNEIIHQENDTNYIINILPCDCLIISPKNNFEIASICYEIGNKHLPLFYQDDELLVPFEKPLFRQLSAMGFEVKSEKRQLLIPLKTTVAPHGESESLFSKIMNLTQKEE
jgi:urease accessory protein